MSKKEKPKQIFTFSSLTIIISVLLIAALNIYCYVGLLGNTFNFYILCTVLTAIVLGLAIVFFFIKRIGLLKVCLVILVIAALFTWGYYLIVVLDWLKYLENPEELQALVKSTGAWGMLVFVFIQFLQVTFIPIPAVVSTLAGVALFGPGLASLLSIIGIMVGSIFAFILGDKFGERIVKWIVGEEKMKKYSNMLYDKGKYMFFLMMLFPVFPDDVLCLVAGMTTMSYRFFLTTIIITRPIGIIFTCYLGSGMIIPFHGWGLAVWAVLIVVMVIAFWLSYKYKDKIENIINNLGNKIKKMFEKNKQTLPDETKPQLLLLEKNPVYDDESKSENVEVATSKEEERAQPNEQSKSIEFEKLDKK